VTSLKSNVLANLAGQGWVALVQLVVVPIYLSLLGVEAYGLIGFYSALLATVQVLDLGIGQTMTRELARRTASSSLGGELHDLVETVERVYWLIAASACALFLVSTPFIVGRIGGASQLSLATLQVSVVLMAVLVTLQLAINFYQCGLIGLEKFALVNLVRIIGVTASAVGGVLILLYAWKSIEALFAWHACVNVGYAISLRLLLRKSLPQIRHTPTFRLDLLRKLWRFAVGMSGVALVAAIASQIDKWILVNLVNLESFGYYSIATTVCTSLYLLIGPLFGVLFSRFSYLVAKKDEMELARVYRGGTQVLVIAIIPVAIALSLFSSEVLNLWTRNAQVSAEAAPLVSILVIGTAVNGIMNAPFALLLAHGLTRLVLGVNLVAMVFLILALTAMVPRYGPMGAAIAWLAFNLAFAFIAVPLTHRRCFLGGARTWVTGDVVLGASGAFFILGAARLVYPDETSDMAKVLYLAGSYALSVVTAALCASQTRNWLFRRAKMVYSSTG
jgi:O-antigen/teichoic acid export membrane protein